MKSTTEGELWAGGEMVVEPSKLASSSCAYCQDIKTFKTATSSKLDVAPTNSFHQQSSQNSKSRATTLSVHSSPLPSVQNIMSLNACSEVEPRPSGVNTLNVWPLQNEFWMSPRNHSPLDAVESNYRQQTKPG